MAFDVVQGFESKQVAQTIFDEVSVLASKGYESYFRNAPTDQHTDVGFDVRMSNTAQDTATSTPAASSGSIVPTSLSSNQKTFAMVIIGVIALVILVRFI